MFEVLAEAPPKAETVINCGEPDWWLKAKRAVIVGRPFLLMGPPIDMTQIEELTTGCLHCAFLDANRVVVWRP